MSTFGCASVIAPSRPVIALTSGATAAGTTGSWFGARRTEPSTRYMFSFTPNACSTWATEPSAATKRRFAGTSTIEKPSDESQLRTAATSLARGEKRAWNWSDVSHW